MVGENCPLLEVTEHAQPAPKACLPCFWPGYNAAVSHRSIEPGADNELPVQSKQLHQSRHDLRIVVSDEVLRTGLVEHIEQPSGRVLSTEEFVFRCMKTF